MVIGNQSLYQGRRNGLKENGCKKLVIRNLYLEKWSLEKCKEVIPRFVSPELKGRGPSLNFK
jgi:hypothetical protein